MTPCSPGPADPGPGFESRWALRARRDACLPASLRLPLWKGSRADLSYLIGNDSDSQCPPRMTETFVHCFCTSQRRSKRGAGPGARRLTPPACQALADRIACRPCAGLVSSSPTRSPGPLRRRHLAGRGRRAARCI